MSAPSTGELLQEGLTLHRRGAVNEAAARYHDVLRIDPANADALYYLALISCQHGRFEEGAALARKSLSSDPNQARVHVILGRALHAQGRSDDALASFDRAIALTPELAPAHANRADVLSKIGRNAEALDGYDRALALAPDSVADWMNRGVALIALNRHDEAVISFDRGFALDPDFAQADDFRAPLLLSKLRICDWTNLPAETAKLLAMVRAGKPLSLPFAIVAIPSSPAEQLQCARRYVQEQPAFPPLWQGEVYAHDRLRVAYLSADFNEHPTAYLTAGLFEQHDKSRFEITALSFGQNDNSPPRRRLEAAFEHFIDVRDNSDQEIAALMRRAEIDIAVDLMGFTKDNRLGVLARRAAPIQVNYLGYPGTMGAPYMDYILADATVIPEDHDAFYAERVVRLPGTYQINDNRRAISQRTPTRGECGLPQNAFVFCCFNNPQKITPEIFDIWMRLLRATDRQRAVADRGQCQGRGQSAPGGGETRRRGGAADFGAEGQRPRSPGAPPAGGSVPRHAALQCPHHGERRAMGRTAGLDLPRRNLRRPRGGKPAQGDRPRRTDHAHARRIRGAGAAPCPRPRLSRERSRTG